MPGSQARFVHAKDHDPRRGGQELRALRQGHRGARGYPCCRSAPGQARRRGARQSRRAPLRTWTGGGSGSVTRPVNTPCRPSVSWRAEALAYGGVVEYQDLRGAGPETQHELDGAFTSISSARRCRFGPAPRTAASTSLMPGKNNGDTGEQLGRVGNQQVERGVVQRDHQVEPLRGVLRGKKACQPVPVSAPGWRFASMYSTKGSWSVYSRRRRPSTPRCSASDHSNPGWYELRMRMRGDDGVCAEVSRAMRDAAAKAGAGGEGTRGAPPLHTGSTCAVENLNCCLQAV